MKVNTADVTFNIVTVEDRTTWAYGLNWGQCAYLMRYLMDSVKDPRAFTVLVVDEFGIVTHMVPMDRLCEIAHV